MKVMNRLWVLLSSIEVMAIKQFLFTRDLTMWMQLLIRNLLSNQLYIYKEEQIVTLI